MLQPVRASICIVLGFILSLVGAFALSGKPCAEAGVLLAMGLAALAWGWMLSKRDRTTAFGFAGLAVAALALLLFAKLGGGAARFSSQTQARQDLGQLSGDLNTLRSLLKLVQSSMDQVKSGQLSDRQARQLWAATYKPQLQKLRQRIYARRPSNPRHYEIQLKLYAAATGYESFLTTIFEGTPEAIHRMIASEKPKAANLQLKMAADGLNSAVATRESPML